MMVDIMVSSAERPRVLSLIPGRVRLHLPGWTAGDVEQVETTLCQVRSSNKTSFSPRLVRCFPLEKRGFGKDVKGDFKPLTDDEIVVFSGKHGIPVS
jgi:hypothetical protein